MLEFVNRWISPYLQIVPCSTRSVGYWHLNFITLHTPHKQPNHSRNKYFNFENVVYWRSCSQVLTSTGAPMQIPPSNPGCFEMRLIVCVDHRQFNVHDALNCLLLGACMLFSQMYLVYKQVLMLHPFFSDVPWLVSTNILVLSMTHFNTHWRLVQKSRIDTR